jgi:very-short-patch-repair endonuclease
MIRDGYPVSGSATLLRRVQNLANYKILGTIRTELLIQSRFDRQHFHLTFWSDLITLLSYRLVVNFD